MATKRQNVVVTGASAGLGRAIAHEFASHGSNVALIARGEPSLIEARKEVELLGGSAMVIPLDVADAAAVQRAAAQVEEAWGPIDVWINNAMVSVFSPVAEMRPEEYKRVTEVTYLGYVYGTLAALKRMRARDRGVIVQVGSALAYRSIPLQSAYCAAKHAIKGFTESLRCELLHDKSNVKVTMVHMPALNTPQFSWVKSRLPRHPQPVPPIYQPEVGAKAVYWAAQKCPREVLVGYSCVKAVVGEKLVPAYADKRLSEMGYESQQTSEPVPQDRPDNLWTPLPQLATTHGDFDKQSTPISPEFWVRSHAKPLAVASAAVASAAIASLTWAALKRKLAG